MSNPWFRFYSAALRNPKVAALSDRDFRLWVALLATSSENDGRLPPANELKHMLNARLDHLLAGLERLIRAGLIDALEHGYTPHHWEKFQYKSDTSTERVRKHREQRNVSETPPDTETEQRQKIEPIAQQPSAARSEHMFDKLLKAAGITSNPHPGLVNMAIIIGMVNGGFDLERDILAGIRAKPNPGARSWGYFEPQIREYVAKRDGAAAASKPQAPSIDWAKCMQVWRESRTWSPAWGPKPDEPKCRVPPELLKAAA